MENKNIKDVAIADKALLTLEEAAKYFNIGTNKLRIMTNEENCPYVVWNGSKRLIKRKPFEEYLYSSYSI
ncbi:excisionase [Ruminococcus sp.]|jgi:excisionase family DNA binding protein|uniref:excisionase n=1 Tax=Ruminococcus sp. TaxID=41978 RepID=UPI0025D33913|nr:excisionase [Ruminococcus sp.]